MSKKKDEPINEEIKNEFEEVWKNDFMLINLINNYIDKLLSTNSFKEKNYIELTNNFIIYNKNIFYEIQDIKHTELSDKEPLQEYKPIAFKKLYIPSDEELLEIILQTLKKHMDKNEKINIVLNFHQSFKNELINNRQFQEYNKKLNIYFNERNLFLDKSLLNLNEIILDILKNVIHLWFGELNKETTCFISKIDSEITKQAIYYANEFLKKYTNIKALILPENKPINKKEYVSLDINRLDAIKNSQLLKNEDIKNFIKTNPLDKENYINELYYNNNSQISDLKDNDVIFNKMYYFIDKKEDVFLNLDIETLKSLNTTKKFKNYKNQINIYEPIFFFTKDDNKTYSHEIYRESQLCIGENIKKSISLEDEIIYILNTIIEFIKKNHENFILPYCFVISHNHDENIISQTLEAIYYANKIIQSTSFPIILKASKLF